MIDAASGLAKLTENYEMAATEQLALQEQIAAEVLNAFNIALGSQSLRMSDGGGTTNAKAQELYWRAQAKNNGERKSLIEAVALLDQAIRLDPRFAHAYVTRGAVLSNLADKLTAAEAEARFAQSRASCAQALKIAPNLPAAQMGQATIYRMDLRFAESLDLFRKALAQPGSDSRIAANLARTLNHLAHYTEAEAVAQKAIDLDPLNNVAWLRKVRALTNGRKFSEATAALEEASRLEPTYYENFVQQAELAWLQGDRNKAMAALSGIRSRENAVPQEILFHARLGDRARVEQLKAESVAVGNDIDDVRMAAVHCCLGEQDAALALLERVAASRDVSALELPSRVDLKPLYDHPRFRAVVNAIGYPKPRFPSAGDIGFYR